MTNEKNTAVFVGNKRITGTMSEQDAKSTAEAINKRNQLREGSAVENQPPATIRRSLQG